MSDAPVSVSDHGRGRDEAARIQAAREAADLANHLERIEWLTGDAPEWSDGSPVESHVRKQLLKDSRQKVAWYAERNAAKGASS